MGGPGTTYYEILDDLESISRRLFLTVVRLMREAQRDINRQVAKIKKEAPEYTPETQSLEDLKDAEEKGVFDLDDD